MIFSPELHSVSAPAQTPTLPLPHSSTTILLGGSFSTCRSHMYLSWMCMICWRKFLWIKFVKKTQRTMTSLAWRVEVDVSRKWRKTWGAPCGPADQQAHRAGGHRENFRAPEFAGPEHGVPLSAAYRGGRSHRHFPEAFSRGIFPRHFPEARGSGVGEGGLRFARHGSTFGRSTARYRRNLGRAVGLGDTVCPTNSPRPGVSEEKFRNPIPSSVGSFNATQLPAGPPRVRHHTKGVLSEAYQARGRKYCLLLPHHGAQAPTTWSKASAEVERNASRYLFIEPARLCQCGCALDERIAEAGAGVSDGWPYNTQGGLCYSFAFRLTDTDQADGDSQRIAYDRYPIPSSVGIQFRRASGVSEAQTRYPIRRVSGVSEERDPVHAE